MRNLPVGMYIFAQNLSVYCWFILNCLLRMWITRWSCGASVGCFPSWSSTARRLLTATTSLKCKYFFTVHKTARYAIFFRVNMPKDPLLSIINADLYLCHTDIKKPALSSHVQCTYSSSQCCGSGIRCLFDPWIRDQDPYPGSGSRMNIPDHTSENLGIFWVKNTQILWCGSGSGIRNLFYPGSGIEKICTRDKHPGSARLLPPAYKYRKFKLLSHAGELG